MNQKQHNHIRHSGRSERQTGKYKLSWLAGFVPQVGHVLTSLWCVYTLKLRGCDGVLRSDAHRHQDWPGRNEQLLLSQCFLHTWSWKVSVSWPEVSSAGENPSRQMWTCLIITTVLTSCCRCSELFTGQILTLLIDLTEVFLMLKVQHIKRF